MNTYRSKVIKSDRVRIKDPDGREAPGFRRAGFSDARNDQTPSRNRRSEIDELRQAHAEEIRQREARAYEEGFQAGRDQSERRQREEMKKRADALDNVIREVAMMKKRIVEEAEEDIIGLSLHIAEVVVHHEIAANREVIHHVLQNAMKNVLDRENLVIRLHPDDHLYLMEIKNSFLQNFDDLKNVGFQRDETIKQGGAVIETQHGEVDARIDQQFREVRQAMQSVRTQREA
ncbi:MAG: FliH/SctL family protein [Pseudomonadota bacterium]|nr:FliH/SctL family protein [Pseudomonadota bacterium]